MVTEKGYRRRTWDEILNAKIAKAKELFGVDINTEENTALGKYIRINAYDQYIVEETAEQIYYSIFPQTCSGQSLDRLGWSVGMTRNVALPARYVVKVVGKAGATIEYGFLVANEAGLNFYCTEDTQISGDGTCEIIVECVEGGMIGNVSASSINRVVNPIAEIDSVCGVSINQVGVDEESDYDFRSRFALVREGKGSCTEASIISALTNIPTVQGAYIIVNESATEIVDDVPPKSIACFIDGGEDYHQEIAEAIFDKKPICVGTYGDNTVLLSYGALKDYEIHFSHAKSVDVYLNINVVTNNEFEERGNEDIKNNLATFIAALGIGKPLITTSMYSQVYSVTGVVNSTITASKDGGTYSMDDIVVEPYERCVLKQLTINGEII